MDIFVESHSTRPGTTHFAVESNSALFLL